jgi:hypothetical protein
MSPDAVRPHELTFCPTVEHLHFCGGPCKAQDALEIRASIIRAAITIRIQFVVCSRQLDCEILFCVRPWERPRPLWATASPSQQRVDSEGSRIADGWQIGKSSDNRSLVSGCPRGIALGAARLWPTKVSQRQDIDLARTDDVAKPPDKLLVMGCKGDPDRLAQLARTVGGTHSISGLRRENHSALPISTAAA